MSFERHKPRNLLPFFRESLKEAFLDGRVAREAGSTQYCSLRVGDQDAKYGHFAVIHSLFQKKSRLKHSTDTLTPWRGWRFKACSAAVG